MYFTNMPRSEEDMATMKIHKWQIKIQTLAEEEHFIERRTATHSSHPSINWPKKTLAYFVNTSWGTP